MGEKIFKKIPTLDFVVGTDKISAIADIIDGTAEGKVYTDIDEKFYGLASPPHIEDGDFSAFVTIMRGCDNFCSYCIVPYVRGRERSKPPQKIINEIKWAAERGVVEITLLGQNVNSYRYGDIDFSKLLEMVAQIENIARIRFITNHPKDFSKKILDVVEKYRDKIPASFHLPLQSGSDKILAAMNRKYTISQYLSIVEDIYRRFPDAIITTDIIVGFPGEDENDFLQTITALNEIGFGGIFAFRYSVRNGTKAAKLKDNVPETEKIARLNEIIKLGIRLAQKYSRKQIGTIQKVLLGNISKKNPEFITSTAPSGRVVLIPRREFFKKFVDVRIEKASTWVLWGTPIIFHNKPF